MLVIGMVIPEDQNLSQSEAACDFSLGSVNINSFHQIYVPANVPQVFPPVSVLWQKPAGRFFVRANVPKVRVDKSRRLKKTFGTVFRARHHLGLLNIFDPTQPLKMLILRPQGGIVGSSSGQNDAVCHC